MPVQVLTNAFVSIGGNDISDHVSSVALAYDVEAQDATAMGDGTRINLGGLKSWSMEVEFNQDFANSAEDDVVWAMADAKVAVACIIRQDAGSVSTSNPNYSGSGLITNYSPFGNSVGDTAKASLSIVSAGTLTRAES
jgi:hypothetical protein